MTQKVASREPCPICRQNGGDTRGDNLVMYEDGHGHCHACGYHITSDGNVQAEASSSPRKVDEPKGGYIIPYPTALSLKGLPKRGIHKGTCDRLGVFSLLHDSGKRTSITGFPLYNLQGELEAVKYRDWLKDKNEGGIWVEGNRSFAVGGLQNINRGTNTLLICEGEPDYLSWSQVLFDAGILDVSCIYLSGGKAGVETLKQVLPTLLQYDVILAPDQDKPGLSTYEELKALFPPIKTRVITYPGLGLLDANDILMCDGSDKLLELFDRATQIVPDNFVSHEELVQESMQLFYNVDKKYGTTTGYPSIDKLIGGYSPGKLIVLAGDTGDGKTTLISNLTYFAILNDLKPYIIPLEMSPAQMVLSLLSVHEQLNLFSDPEAVQKIPKDTFLNAYDTIVKKANWAKHYGVLSIEEFTNLVQTAVSVYGTKLVILDHITAATVGLDWQSSEAYIYKIKELAMQHQICILVISHVTTQKNDNLDEDDDKPSKKKRFNKSSLRGSRAFAQVPDVVLGIERKDKWTIIYPIKLDRFINSKEDAVLRYENGRFYERDTNNIRQRGGTKIPSTVSRPGVSSKDVSSSTKPKDISNNQGVREGDIESITTGVVDESATKIHSGLVPAKDKNVLRDKGKNSSTRPKKAPSGIATTRSAFSDDSL